MHPDNCFIVPNGIEKVLFLKLHIVGAGCDRPHRKIAAIARLNLPDWLLAGGAVRNTVWITP
jgi:hypothetical protein